MIELRPHQSKAIEQLRSSMRAGHKRIVLGANVSFGKTIVAAFMMMEAFNKGKRGIFICDRIQLVEQALAKFEECGLDVGVIQGNHEKTRPWAPIQVASIQTIKSRNVMPEFDFAIVDECFPAGTIVNTPSGPKEIQFVSSGDTVYNAFGTGIVRSVFSKSSSEIYRVRVSNGKVIRCTGDHPFFTSSGWKEARKLVAGQKLYGFKDLSGLWERSLSEKVQEGCGEREDVHGESMLLKLLLKEAEEPHARSGDTQENVGYSGENRAQAKGKGWKWGWRVRAAEAAKRAIGCWVGFGVHTEYGAEKLDGREASSSLQNRYSKQINDGSDRGGRWEPLHTRATAEGYEEDCFFESLRVESVEIEKRGGDEVVYNLRVGGHPSYFVDGILVHNCHGISQALIKLMEMYNNVPFIGLSATPYSKGLGKYYTDLVVPITARELLEMGWLCPVKYYAGEQPDLSAIKLKTDKLGTKDYDPASLAIEMEKPKLIGDVVATWKKLGEDSQTIAFCPSISHSRGLVEEFNRSGVKAVHIDAYTEPEARQKIYQMHNDGEFKILSCSSLLNTGYDSPTTRCIIDCYPTKSLIRFIQRAGRIMRIAPGKEYGIYLDHSSNVCRHGFAEDIVPDCLHDGEKQFQEEAQVKKDEKKEPIICECCNAIMVAGKCLVCGHEVKRKKKDLEVVAGELQEVDKGIDQAFYSGLLHHARQKGYDDGWAYHKYKEKFGSAPLGAKKEAMPDVRVAGYIKHLNIKRAKGKHANNNKGQETINKLLGMFDG